MRKSPRFSASSISDAAFWRNFASIPTAGSPAGLVGRFLASRPAEPVLRQVQLLVPRHGVVADAVPPPDRRHGEAADQVGVDLLTLRCVQVRQTRPARPLNAEFRARSRRWRGNAPPLRGKPGEIRPVSAHPPRMADRLQSVAVPCIEYGAADPKPVITRVSRG